MLITDSYTKNYHKIIIEFYANQISHYSYLQRKGKH